MNWTTSIDTYGYDPSSLLQSPEEVRQRLQGILADKVLRFNPYSVDDDTLLACVERAHWQPFPALTQMVVFHFHDIRRVDWEYPYDAIFFHIGNATQEHHIPVRCLTERVTYTATLSQIHVMVNGRPLTNIGMVEKMQGKSYFVSHALMARGSGDKIIPAYRMVRLMGKNNRRAETICRSMISSKMTMLEEILAYPYSSDYLHCSRDFIDYTTPIKETISIIKRFADLKDKIKPKGE